MNDEQITNNQLTNAVKLIDEFNEGQRKARETDDVVDRVQAKQVRKGIRKTIDADLGTLKPYKDITKCNREDFEYMGKLIVAYEGMFPDTYEGNEEYIKIANKQFINRKKLEVQQMKTERKAERIDSAQSGKELKTKSIPTEDDERNRNWLLDNVVFLSDGFYILEDDHFIKSHNHFNDYYGQYKLQQVDGKSRVTITKPLERIVDSADKLTARAVVWEPVSESKYEKITTIDGQRCVNTYKPTKISIGRKGDVSKWLELVNFICGKYADNVLDHMAYTLQYPEKKIIWQVMIFDDTKRNGKTAMFTPILEIMGSNAGTVDATMLDAQWGDMWLQRKVVLLEEIHSIDNKQFNSLKTKFANSDYEMLNIKGRGVVRQANRYSIYMLSNYEDAVRMDIDEDKLLVIKGPGTFIRGDSVERGTDSDKWYSELWNWYRSGGVANVCHFLMNRDVSQFGANSSPTRTDALDLMCRRSVPVYEELIQDRIDAKVEPFDRPVFHLSELKTILTDADGYMGKLNDKMVGGVLRKNGYINHFARSRKDGRAISVKVWLKPELVSENTTFDIYKLWKEPQFIDKQRQNTVWATAN